MTRYVTSLAFKNELKDSKSDLDHPILIGDHIILRCHILLGFPTTSYS